ncbi:MAG: hypothetical protein ABSC10_22095 [Candidatus Acidiferrales bacterium]|jgi:hypothetical protein
MRFVLLSLIAAACVAGPHPIQNASSEPTARAIKFRLLNGKNGKPIKNENPSIWIGDATEPINPYTDSHGEIVVNVTDIRSQQLRVLPDWDADCRFKGDSDAGMQVKYSLNKIITTGVVSENLCGKRRIDPVPGVLVLYLRPRTFMEKWAL